MNKDMTYCANENCSKKYKCDLYKEEKDNNGQEFWFTIYDQDDCPNKQ